MSDGRKRFACQTYSWQMSFEAYRGRLDHMLDVTRESGFTGFEPEVVMLGEAWTADTLRRALDAHELELAALALTCAWRHPRESPDEVARADRAIEALRSLPGAVLNLVHYPGPDRKELRERQSAAMACMRSVAQRADLAGVRAAFHANSPKGSVFRIQADYDRLLEELDPLIGFTPDFGHIAAGGMDWRRMIPAMGGRIMHVHIKDLNPDGTWAATGTGDLNIPGIIGSLDAVGYTGWITFEDESTLAETNPDEAVRATGRYISRTFTTSLTSD